MTKRKIAILGGGIAALTTAYLLTEEPDWQDKYEITLYQMGWRLGGKCAAGRGASSRIEEHGIHLFGGGYYNTLRMMRDVCRKVYPGTGDAEFAYRFKHQYTSLRVEGKVKTKTKYPENARSIDETIDINTIHDLLATALRTLKQVFSPQASAPQFKTVIRFGDGEKRELSGTLDNTHPVIEFWLGLIDHLANAIQGKQDNIAATLDLLGSVAGPHRQGFTIDAIRTDGEGRLSPSMVRARSALSRFLEMLNFAFALGAGYLTDIVLGGLSLANLDQINYAKWLRKHGAWNRTLESDLVLSPIRILYQYENGDNTQPQHRSMGAGAYLHWTLRTMGYVRSPFWTFRIGTADTVITPLYEWLRSSGVRFEFFRKVESLKLSRDGSRIETVILRKQATTRSGGPYEPLDHGQWPATPLYHQLNEETEIVLAGLPPETFESYWSDFNKHETMELDHGSCFDEVVLAIGLGAIPFLCQDLLAIRQDWRDMVLHVKTVQTQSLQIWMDKTSHDLGLNSGLDEPMGPGESALGDGLAAPFDGLADFSDLLAHEHWPAPPARTPKSLWYFSDVLPTPAQSPHLGDPTYPQGQHTAAMENCRIFLERELPRLLRSITSAPGSTIYDRLVPTDPATAPDDAALLAQQVVRANVQPSERYVQALADTTRFRLDAGWAKGISNLVLAGDWTYNGFNVGCVEAAVMSGKLAGNALRGVTPIESDVTCYFGR